MSIARKINALLSAVGIAIVRRSTLNRVMAELHSAQNAGVELLRDGNAEVIKKLDQIARSQDELLKHQISTKWEMVDYVQRSSLPQSGTRACPLCGAIHPDAAYRKYQSHCIFGGGLLLRFQCPECDVIFGPDKMFQLSGEELSQDYEWHYKVYSEGDSTEQELRTFYALQPSRDGIYVNYGAGAWSRSVEILRGEGWNVYAYEPHGSASNGAEYVITGRAELEKMRFDGLFSNNVLEHLRHPADELIFMHSLLKPGGRMSHSTPCFEYLYEYTRFHLFFFPGRSRNMLAKKAGLRIDSFEVDKEYMNCVFTALPR